MLRPATYDGHYRPVLRYARFKRLGNERRGSGSVLFGGRDGHRGQELLADIWLGDLRRPIRGRGEIGRGPLAERMNNQIVALASGRQRMASSTAVSGSVRAAS